MDTATKQDIENLRNEFSQKFDSIDKKIYNMDKKICNIDKKICDIDKKICGMDQEFNSIKQELTDFRKECLDNFFVFEHKFGSKIDLIYEALMLEKEKNQQKFENFRILDKRLDIVELDYCKLDNRVKNLEKHF